MDKVYEELEEVKADNEKLKAEYKRKTELLENLKRAQNEQLIKIREVNSANEKQVQELDEKTAELSMLRQTNEDLKRSLTDKESILKRVSAANDKLRADGEEKYRKCEEENGRLLFAFEEANERNIDLEQKINVYRAEIEGLQGLLSASQKKCMEAEKNAKAPKELKARDNVLIRLEEEKSNVEEKLKWKKEQFKHLEEAHDKLKTQFKASKTEWEHERSTLVDEISSLHTKLDSQTRISEDLQKKLQMCNNALTQEETRRKYLELQYSEFKTRYEDVFAECQDAKSQLDCLADRRDKEVATLRHSLSTKEAYYKEMEYQKRKLEQENLELLASVQELQEASIQGSGNSALAKLKSKLKSVEQTHKNCSANLRAKEAEWSYQWKKITEEIDNYRLQLESKEAALKRLETELENCLSSAIEMKMQHEEASIMSLVLNSTVSEAQVKLADANDEMILNEEEGKEKISLLMEQLELKNIALARAQRDTEEERQNYSSLLKRVESVNLIEDHQLQMQKETDRYKEMLEESSRCQARLKEQVKKMERDHEKKLREVCDALDMANSDLAEKREKEVCLMRRIESFGVVEDKQLLMQKEIERYKEMLDKSREYRHHLEEQVSQLESDSKEKIRQLCNALDSSNFNLEEEREKKEFLMRNLESTDQIAEQRRKELERYKEMLEESSRCQLLLKQRVLQVESESERELAEVSEALEIANSELTEKICEAHRLEFESWVWKSIAERFKADLEENQNLRKKLEASLLAQVEVGETMKQERDELVHKLEAVSSARTETASCFELEKETLLEMMREKDKILKDLQKEVDWLEQESFRRELEGAAFAHITAEKAFENEKENLAILVEEKDQKLDKLEQNLKSTLESFSSELAQKQAEVDMVYQAWEKIAAAEIMAELEIEEKRLMIIELEGDICNIQMKLESQEESLSRFRLQSLEIEAELEMKRNELKELTGQMQGKLRTSDALVNELNSGKRNLLEEVTKLSSERENLLCLIREIDDGMCKLSNEDMKLMGDLEKIMQSFDRSRFTEASSVNDEFSYSAKENLNTPISLQPVKKQDIVFEERSPFRLLN